MNLETDRLERVASNSLYTTMSNRLMIEYCFLVFRRHLKSGSILEMGPAEGLMTEKLNTLTDDLTLVEGSSIFCSQLHKKYPTAQVIHTLFEDFEPKRKFDNIILGHVLEHVEDPVEILRISKEWLTPGGKILGAVPNSQSIHRQAAVLMGLLETEESMSDLDIHHGHRRIYNPFSFRNDFQKAGLDIIHYGGYWNKPISNAQIHENWTEEMLWAFLKLGERYPDTAAEIYVIAGVKNS